MKIFVTLCKDRSVFVESEDCMKALKNILIPVDFSSQTQHVLKLAQSWAKLEHAKIHVLFINELVSMPFVDREFPYGLANFKELDEEIHKWAEKEFEKLLKKTPADNIRFIIKEGKVADAVVAYADSNHIDLTIMATHAKTDAEDLFIGSNTNRVLHRTNSPMLVMREPKHAIHYPPKHILLTTDFSKSSTAVFEYAAFIAANCDCKISILSIDSFEGSFLEKLTQYHREKFFTPFAELSERISVRQGRALKADEGIFNFLDSNPDVDLIAMASHGRSGLNHILLGSTTESVIRKVNIPVLVARSFFNEEHKPEKEHHTKWEMAGVHHN